MKKRGKPPDTPPEHRDALRDVGAESHRSVRDVEEGVNIPLVPGASKGALKHVTIDQSVSDEESRDGAMADAGRGRPLDDGLERANPSMQGGTAVPVTALKGLFANKGGPVSIEAMAPRYTLAELLAQCDPTAPIPDDMREWELAPPVGREFGAVQALPISRVRRELRSLIRRGMTVEVVQHGRVVGKAWGHILFLA